MNPGVELCSVAPIGNFWDYRSGERVQFKLMTSATRGRLVLVAGGPQG